MTKYVIETKNLTKAYSEKVALDALSIGIKENEITAIVGANGAGKSTLFKILLGVLKPTEGEASILGVTPKDLTPLLRRKIGFVNEEHSLFEWLPIRSLKKMQMSLYPLWDEQIFQNVINHFDVDESQQVSKLSRGERAGVNLAMTLAQKPEVLLLDEPTLGLDVIAKKAFLEALMSIQQMTNNTIVYCSHAMDEIERVAENVIIIERGKLQCTSTPEQLLARLTCWIVDFGSSALPVERIPGLMKVKNVEGLHQIVLLDQNLDVNETLYSLGASSVISMPVNLDLAISAFLGKNHAGTKLIDVNTSV
jgi:ABC-2 type transport system ATP-binding protein